MSVIVPLSDLPDAGTLTGAELLPLVQSGATVKALLSALAALFGVPAGVMFTYGGATPPPGYLLCDGAAVSRATYAALFAAIGDSFGPGDGSTTFNLPDAQGRCFAAEGAAGSDPLVRGVNTGHQYSQVGGSSNAAHLHTVPMYSSAISATPGTAAFQGVSNAANLNKNTSSNGASSAFSTQPPVVVGIGIIKT